MQVLVTVGRGPLLKICYMDACRRSNEEWRVMGVRPTFWRPLISLQ